MGNLNIVLIAPRRYVHLARLFSLRIVSADNGSELMHALRAAFAYKPKVIFVAKELIKDIHEEFVLFKYENPIPIIVEVDMSEKFSDSFLERIKCEHIG